MGKLPNEENRRTGDENLIPTASYGNAVGGPGGQIGRYKLLGILGEGGYGVVYLAEQEKPFKRKVALKVIKPGMDSKQIIARFEAERQALALLDHPNIAHVHDAGTTENGQPYFVMEYVKGVPITEHCDNHKLDIKERLRLFIQVCEAVQHAHQKGIIHRDIKPSNILVSIEGDKAIPRVIDFGIAKTLSRSLTENTLVTEQGHLIGTPEYMSPEQADLNAQDIDTRSDVYSLGAVLYELLTGVLPFDPQTLRGGGIEQIRRIISEEEPRTPSVRLSNLGAESQPLAKCRQSTASSLARCLKSELEWIPLKAMRKDRMRRYRSASELADDIGNYLEGRPLIAGPETATYRMGKFFKKHTGSIVAVAIILTTIIIGFLFSSIMYYKAEKARKREAIAHAATQLAEKAAMQERDRAKSEAARANEQAESYRRALYMSNITLAQTYQNSENWRGAQELLITCPEDLRSWEWYYLWNVSRQEKRYPNSNSQSQPEILAGHEGWVTDVAFAPDGSKIVSGGEDKTVRLWNTIDGAQIMVLQGHTDKVTCVTFSPDSKIIASGCINKTIKLWDAKTGGEIRSFDSDHGGGMHVAFSPDGKYIASSGVKGIIKILEVATGAEFLNSSTPYSNVDCVLFIGNGNLVCIGDTSSITILDISKAKNPMSLEGHISSVFDIAYSADDNCIVSGGVDNTVRVWDAENGEISKVLYGHKHVVRTVALSIDSNRIASGSLNGMIKIWDRSTGTPLMTLASGAPVISLAFGGKDRYLISAHRDGKVRVWTAATEEQVATDINASARQRDSKTGRLIGWWKFDEAGGNTAEDSSGNGLHGTLMGNPERVAGRLGSALRFNGKDDYVDCGSSTMFNITGSMTIAAWIQLGPSEGFFDPIITKGDSAWRLHRCGRESNLEFSLSDPRSRPLLVIRGRQSLDDGPWHHVAGTYNGRIMCIYIDGKLDTSMTVNPVYDADINDKAVYIGSNSHYEDRWWKGLIDDVRIYNYALTADEVTALCKVD